MSNRLPVLAESIRRAHSGVLDAAKTAAERAIEAGHALLEAKSLVKHGEWLPWLKEHCQLPERTAQLYMAIAKTGLESATVADIGLKAASKVEWTLYDPDYNPFHHVDADGQREWHAFVLFLHRTSGFAIDGAAQHVEWLLNKQFKTPTEWLGDEGARWRRVWGMRDMPEKVTQAWHTFLADLAGKSSDDIEAILVVEKQAGAA